MSKYILALDQGTTSSRSIIFDHDGHIVSQAQQEFTQHFPTPGYVEHDPMEIWQTQLSTAKFALKNKNIKAQDIAAIGISNQRETTILWNKETGQPIYNAIVWQDRRTTETINHLKLQGHELLIQQKTGLVLDAYFSATKIKWILDNVLEAKELANHGKLAFGTIDSWLIWNLTGDKLHVTDESNASRTLLFNIHTGTWDDDLLTLFGIPSSILPTIVPSSGIIAHTDKQLFSAPIIIAGVAGDQQAATFGNLCTQPGMLKNTYGTGCFLVMNIGDQILTSNNKLLTSIAWNTKSGRNYCLEGSTFVGGAVTQWLRDGLEIIKKPHEIEPLANSVPDNGGVYMVPAFTGLGAPYWDQGARGSIFGITRGTTKAHIARSALESIAFQVYDLIVAMQNDTNYKITQLRVDGGACANDLLMQFQADLLDMEVERPKCLELTALGACFLAGIAVHFWQSTEELTHIWQLDKQFTPQMSTATRSILLEHWSEAVSRAQHWL